VRSTLSPRDGQSMAEPSDLDSNPHSGSDLEVRPFMAEDTDEWDAFVDSSPVGTFLQSRKYLSHQDNRFHDESRLIVDNRTGSLLAVVPAARDSTGRRVVSHPGLTFGGLIYGHRLHGAALEAALAALLASFAAGGFESLDYRPVPAFARKHLGDEDVYALSRLGSLTYSRGLGAVIEVAVTAPTPSRRRDIKRAERSGLELNDDWDYLEPYWKVLEAQLLERHRTRTVHSFEEMHRLRTLFPSDIQLRVALLNGSVVAGALVYRYRSDVLHTQYLASDDTGRRLAALDLVIGSIVDDARANSVRYVSLGTSNDPETGAVNEGLFNYKRSHGADGMGLHGLRIDLNAS
jgi:hypothetical protein